MREIEFRVWDKKVSQMVCWKDISRTRILGMLVNNNNRSASAGVLMQYTGLKDKNGVKIFEGDVVRFIDSEGRDSIIEVRFENGGFYPFAPDYLHCSYVEVIGNKFENPELLGENK